MTERIIMPAILWLALLPTEEFEKALKASRSKKCGSYSDTRGTDIEVDSLCNAIFASFLWADSEDGHDYWSGIANRVYRENV